jgi:hypothetical protein
MTDEVKKKERHEEKPLDKMTITELREIALEIPRTTAVHDMKKEELLTLIKEYRGIKDETQVRKAPGNVGEIKGRIRQLKGEKTAAQEARDHKRVIALRRRISRLKKQTRRIARA